MMPRLEFLENALHPAMLWEVHDNIQYFVQPFMSFCKRIDL